MSGKEEVELLKKKLQEAQVETEKVAAQFNKEALKKGTFTCLLCEKTNVIKMRGNQTFCDEQCRVLYWKTLRRVPPAGATRCPKCNDVFIAQNKDVCPKCKQAYWTKDEIEKRRLIFEKFRFKCLTCGKNPREGAQLSLKDNVPICDECRLKEK